MPTTSYTKLTPPAWTKQGMARRRTSPNLTTSTPHGYDSDVDNFVPRTQRCRRSTIQPIELAPLRRWLAYMNHWSKCILNVDCCRNFAKLCKNNHFTKRRRLKCCVYFVFRCIQYIPDYPVNMNYFNAQMRSSLTFPRVHCAADDRLPVCVEAGIDDGRQTAGGAVGLEPHSWPRSFD